MELGLAGKTVIVTGGSSHIGAGIVRAFAKEGSNVVIADADEPQAQKTAEIARKQGGRVLVVKTDVTKPEQCEAMVKKTLDELGRLDVLVNNAGWGYGRLFYKKPKEEAAKEMDVCFWGVFNCIKAVIDYMVAQKSGRIVNTASMSGKEGTYGLSTYSAAKGAVITLTRALAREFGRFGININAVCPGATYPPSAEELGEGSMWRRKELAERLTHDWQAKAIEVYPLRRFGTPEDIANATVFLASDAASWITGQALSVDGGYFMA